MNEDEVILEQVEKKENVAAGYLIALNDSGVYLTINPRYDEKTFINEVIIFEELKKREVKDYDRSVIIRAIKEADGQPIKVAETPVAVPMAEPDIRVLITRDQMEASLQITLPEGSRPLGIDEVLKKINNLGVVYGINHEYVKRTYDYPGFSIICAEGQQPVHGENAYIKYHINIENEGRPEEMEDGSVNFKNLNLFIVVQEGDLLAEKIPATQGTPGINIFGNTINGKPGKDIRFPVGKNVQIIENSKIVSMIAGRLLIVNNKINVVPVIEIKEDVDVSTGNIEFIGDVIVHGSVQPGFAIKTEGNVEVFGTISGGTVEGRNVIVKMGIQGMQRGYVRATENVVANFIENATVHAGADAIVSDVVLNSRISADKKIIVEGKRGLIAGGTVMAGEEIRAKVVGTHMSSGSLQVGFSPALREEYQHIRGEVKKVERDIEKIQKALTILRLMDRISMPPDKREMLLKLTKTQFHLIGQGEQIRSRIAVIESQFDKMRDGRIRVADIIYPGVKVVVGTLVKPIGEILKFTSLYAEDGEIKIGSFR